MSVPFVPYLLRIDPDSVFVGLTPEVEGLIYIKQPDGSMRRVTRREALAAALIMPRLRGYLKSRRPFDDVVSEGGR
jgi:hypothetical protein